MVFVALALAAGAQSWVPLNSTKAKAMQGQIPAQAPTPIAVPSVRAPAPAVPVAAVPPVIAPPPQPVITQTAPADPPATATAGTIDRPLQITCLGSGTANKAAVASAFGSSWASGLIGGHSWSGSGWGSSTIVGTRQQGFGDQVDIRIFTGDDRIRMPRTMLPWIHGGDHGWFKLKDVVADARSIRASAAVAMLNNPKVYIDRVTGTISISGKAGDYTGQCQAIDASAAPKF